MTRVLLVEDEQSAAEVLAVLLEMEGYKVSLAANGKRAIEMLSDVQPDLIITDWMMPVMNGIDLAKAVRARPEYFALPILMTSGAQEDALRAETPFVSAFLRKPFQIETLLEAIKRLLSKGEQTSS
jgi:two-component system response regulator VicR